MNKEYQEKTTDRMGFFEHLDELRARLMRCLWLFLIGAVGGYFVSNQIMEILREPLFAAFPDESQRKLFYTGIFENFLVHLKIAGYSSFFIMAPLFFQQIWGFVSPGLYDREKRMVLPFVLATTVFFLAGAAFTYFLIFPVGFKYFLEFGSSTEIPMLTMDNYYTTCLRLLLLSGLAFEFPVIVVLFGLLGIVDSATLRSNRKPVIIGITVVAALFAPPDAVSMLLLMAPLILFFEGAIHFLSWTEKRKLKGSF